MKKNFFLKFFLFAIVASLVTFTSCKDYDDDIDSLNTKIEALKVSEMKTQLESMIAAVKTSVEAADAKAEAAQKTADAAVAAGGDAKAIAEAAQKVADEAKAAAEAAQKAVDAATGEAKEIAENALRVAEAAAEGAQAAATAAKNAGDDAKAAQKVANEAKAAAKTALEKATLMEAEINSLKDRVKALEESGSKNETAISDLQKDIAAMSEKVMNLFGHRLTSITLVPEFHVNGIAAIKLETMGYLPGKSIKWQDQHEYGLAYDFVDPDPNKMIFKDNGNTVVKFRLSPRSLAQKSVGFPYFESIISENIDTRAVSEELTGKNSPIEPIPGQTLEITPEGILNLKVQKSTNLNINHEQTDLLNGNLIKETFYFASLGIPITEEYLTDEEKTEGGAVVTSEHYRVYEEMNIPRIKSTIADDEIVQAYDFAGEIADNKHYTPYALDKNLRPVHYSSAYMLYKSGRNEKVDTVLYWKEPFDLRKLVTVCTVFDHATLENYADYGLEFQFKVHDEAYLQGDNKTDQQQFAEIKDNYFLHSRVYTIDGATQTAIGREPIIEVTLYDKVEKKVVDIRYIKVKWGDKPAEPQVLPPYTFEANPVSCDYIENRFGTQEMNELIYRQIEEKWGISKENFHDIYESMEIMDLMKGADYLIKDGTLLDPALTTTVVEGTTEDVKFYYVSDPNDNTSYNLVWKMSPKAVGQIVPKDKETYKITIKFVDKTASKLSGDIYMDFIMDVTIPKQMFTYQGTYWKDGVGEGVFNVNPIVYNPKALTEGHGNPPAVGASHIETDLVNGYIFKETKKKPANLAEFINYLQGCAKVKFVFDDSRFEDYDYLKDYTVSPNKESLWKGGTPTNLTAFNYVQDEALAASINNMFGAAVDKKPSLYKDNKNPVLGTGNDEASAVIRLHEKAGEAYGTDPAIGLIGKNVPVNLVVAYNEYNEVAVQKFEVHFIEPLTIDGAVTGNFKDAVIGGSFLDVQKGFTFTDWNLYKVAKAKVGTGEKEKWAEQLYKYYNVNTVKFDTENVSTSLKLQGDTYIHAEGTTDGELPTDRSLKQVIEGAAGFPDYEVVTQDPTHLGYFNNDGTPVNVNYNMFIDVSVAYKWGTLQKPGLKVKVEKADGTPSE